MLIYLSLNFIRSHRIDLADFGAGSNGLPQHHVQKSQFAVDGRLDDKVGFALSDHLHVELHVFQGLFHPVNLGTTVEAVLSGALGHQVVLLLGQLVVFFGLQILFAGDELVLVKGLLLLVCAPQTVYLHSVFQHVLAHVYLLLCHLNLGVAEDILLLGQFGLGVEDLQVKVVVIEDEDGIAGLHRGAFLDEDLLHDAAFLRAQLDGGHRLHPAADADVVVEFALYSVGDSHGILIHAQSLVVRPCNQVHDKHGEQCSQPPGQGFFSERYAPSGFLLNNLIHFFTDLRIQHHCNTSPPPV